MLVELRCGDDTHVVAWTSVRSLIDTRWVALRGILLNVLGLCPLHLDCHELWHMNCVFEEPNQVKMGKSREMW